MKKEGERKNKEKEIGKLENKYTIDEIYIQTGLNKGIK